VKLSQKPWFWGIISTLVALAAYKGATSGAWSPGTTRGFQLLGIGSGWVAVVSWASTLVESRTRAGSQMILIIVAASTIASSAWAESLTHIAAADPWCGLPHTLIAYTAFHVGFLR